jgi:hypothetical protein
MLSGWQSMTSGTTDMYKCCAMVHAANLSTDLAEKVKVPQCILPSGEDPSTDEIKAVLDKKDFGADCVYKVYTYTIYSILMCICIIHYSLQCTMCAY